MDTKLNTIEMNEHNVRMLLQLVLSVMTDEQIEKVNELLENLEFQEVDEEEK